MSIKKYIKENEKIHKKDKEIKYLFCESNHDKLVVTFPGFSGLNQPPKYNYIKTLIACNCHKLFILDDYGPRGSYLIGENGDHSIEDSVISLIEKIRKKYGISQENIIVQGSSKGGYSALYYGIKYSFGYVIVGAPQTLLGNYLSNFPEIADYISGGHESENLKYLNSLLYDLINDHLNDLPKIFIHIGKGDHHYQNHIIPFLLELNKTNLKYQLDLVNYSFHSFVGRYYVDYLLKTLHDIDETLLEIQNPLIQKTFINASNGFLEVDCLAKGENFEYSFEIFYGNEIFSKKSFQKNRSFKHPINFAGTYYAKIYVKEDERINYKYTEEVCVTFKETLKFIEANEKLKTKNFLQRKLYSFSQNILKLSKLKLFSYKPINNLEKQNKLNVEKKRQNKFKFSINKPQSGDEYAWYILKNGERIDTIWYQPESVLKYTFKESGNYQVKYFIKNGDLKRVYNSDIIYIN